MTGLVPAATALAGRNLRHFLASPRAVVGSLVFPLLLMAIMLVTFGELVDGVAGGAYIDRLAPLIVLYTAAFGAATTALGMFGDLRSGLVDRVRSLPVHPAAFLVGRVGADLARILGLAAITTVVAAALGFRLSLGPLAAVGFFAVVPLFGSMFVWVALVIALRSRNEDSVSGAVNGPLTLLLFLATGFAPVEAFPAALAPVVRANPLSVAGNALMGLSVGGPVLVPVLQTLAWVLGVTVVTAPTAIVLLRRRIPR